MDTYRIVWGKTEDGYVIVRVLYPHGTPVDHGNSDLKIPANSTRKDAEKKVAELYDLPEGSEFVHEGNCPKV